MEKSLSIFQVKETTVKELHRIHQPSAVYIGIHLTLKMKLHNNR